MINLLIGILIGGYLSAGFVNLVLRLGQKGIFGSSTDIEEVLRCWLLWPWNRF